MFEHVKAKGVSGHSLLDIFEKCVSEYYSLDQLTVILEYIAISSKHTTFSFVIGSEKIPAQ